MRFPPRVGYALGASAVFALTAAAASASTVTGPNLFQKIAIGPVTHQAGHAVPSFASGLPPSLQRFVRFGKPQVHGFITPAERLPGGAEAFISDYNNDVVYVLNAQGQVTATLTGFASPDGMTTDKNGNLYVTNQGTNSVLELAPPYTSVTTSYSDPNELPLGVAVDKNGNVAVTNIFTTSGSPGNVVFYAAGSTTPTGAASSATFTSPRFCAFDKNGDLALDDQDIFNTDAVNVGAVLRGNINNMSGNIITLPTSNTIEFPGGVQVNGSNQLAVGDQLSTPLAVYTYNVSSGPSLTLAQTTPEDNASDTVNFVFVPGFHQLLTADYGNNNVQLYAYPAGGAALKTATIPGSSGLIGEAIVPTAQFSLR